MTIPFEFPAWVPWWVPVAILVPALLYALVFLAMPFSVIGLKSRLDVLEARLDEIQGEIRTLVLRLPVSEREIDAPAAPRREFAPRPPIPPPPARQMMAAQPPPPTAQPQRFQQRAEPARQEVEGSEREPVFRTDRDEAARGFGGSDRLAAAEERARFGAEARRAPPPPPPPARRAEPRLNWPPHAS